MWSTKQLLTFALAALLITFVFLAQAQRTYLRADGNSDGTYALIDSVLIEGTSSSNAWEVPDCVHPRTHITQRIDTTLGVPVFNFVAHVSQDNDRCINFDRQRTEIKAYDKSPANMKCFYGESASYSWDMRLNSQFVPSPDFTHVFQIKASGGDESKPFITITLRGKRDGRRELEVQHAGQDSDQKPFFVEPLEKYAGRWVHIAVEYECKLDARFHMRMSNLETGAELMRYTNDHMDLWRSGNNFLRPKWGIYRSLVYEEWLRDENVYFNNFCLAKGNPKCD